MLTSKMAASTLENIDSSVFNNAIN